MTLKPRGKFKPKIGQLVSWDMGGSIDGSYPKEHLGLITHIFPDGLVEVSFLKNNWIITLQLKHLRLLNDVASTE